MALRTYVCRRCEGVFEFEAPAKPLPKTIPCPSCGSAETAEGSGPAKGSTGTYRFVPELGTVVRVSSRVPGLHKGSSGEAPSCPPGGCGSCEFN